MTAPVDVRFARQGSQWVAYAVEGSGPLDIVFVSPLLTHVEVMCESRQLQHMLERLGSLGRVIRFDRRGTGLSGPSPGRGVGSLDDWSKDVEAVLRDVGASRVCLFTVDSGAPCCLLFAATHPERVQSIVLIEPWVPFTGDLAGDEVADWTCERVDRSWGEVPGITHLLSPALARNPADLAWWARFQRNGMSRSTAVQAFRDFLLADVTGAVPSVQAPVLIIHRSQNLSAPWLREHLADVRSRTIEHTDLHWWWQDDLRSEMLDATEEHLTGRPATPDLHRTLATVMFTDLVASTERAAAVGDNHWREILDRHDASVGRALDAYGGDKVKSTGDGVLALFDMPTRAVRCAAEIRRALADIGLGVRIGIHTGEVERRDTDIGGIAVHVAARIAALAAEGEILSSRTVADLAVGSELVFTAHGEHQLKGVPGSWQLVRADV